MDKQQIVREAAVWLLEWLEKTDPDFKGASIILMTTTLPKEGETSCIFYMVSNESAVGMVSILLHGLNQALDDNGIKSVLMPSGMKQ